MNMRFLGKVRLGAAILFAVILLSLYHLVQDHACSKNTSMVVGQPQTSTLPVIPLEYEYDPPTEDLKNCMDFKVVVFMSGVNPRDFGLMTATYGFLLRKEGIKLKFVTTPSDYEVRKALQEAYEEAECIEWYILMELNVLIEPKILRTLVTKTSKTTDILYGKQCCTPFSSGTIILGASMVQRIAKREFMSLRELYSNARQMVKEPLLAPGIPLWNDASPLLVPKFSYTSVSDVERYFWRVHSGTEQRREGYYNLPVGDRVAIILTTFNMPERTKKMHEYLKTKVKWPVDIIIVDNGSEPEHVYQDATVKLKENVQTNHGWMMGVAYAEAIASVRREAFLGIVLTITSATVEEGQGDIIAEMAKILKNDPSVAGVHPALTKFSTTQWTNLITEHDVDAGVRARDREQYPPRTTWMIDNIFAMWRGDWYFRFGRFDPLLTYAWGVDVETSFIATVFNMKVVVAESILVSKETDVGYTMNRMGMQKNDRRLNAREEVCAVYRARFGADIWRYNFFRGSLELADHWKKQCDKVLTKRYG